MNGACSGKATGAADVYCVPALGRQATSGLMIEVKVSAGLAGPPILWARKGEQVGSGRFVTGWIPEWDGDLSAFIVLHCVC